MTYVSISDKFSYVHTYVHLNILYMIAHCIYSYRITSVGEGDPAGAGQIQGQERKGEMGFWDHTSVCKDNIFW